MRRLPSVLFALVVLALSARIISARAPVQVAFPFTATVQFVSNLRAGPSTSYAIVAQAQPGDTVVVDGCNEACDWYRLDSGEWIADYLVQAVQPALPLPTPTATPTPSQIVSLLVGAWNVESGGADPNVVGRRIAAFQDVDLWGLSEVGSTALKRGVIGTIFR